MTWKLESINVELECFKTVKFSRHNYNSNRFNITNDMSLSVDEH